MTEAFLGVVRLSASASWLVLAVIGFRGLLKKAPKYMRVLLWGLVAVRLLCPVSFESVLSLVPESVSSGEALEQWTAYELTPVVSLREPGETLTPGTGSIPAGDTAAVPDISPEPGGDSADITETAPVTVGDTVVPVMSGIWTAGVAVLGLYALVSYWRLYRRVRTAVRLRDNVYQSEFTDSPFVLGFFRPRIYLPFMVEQRDLPHIMAHERAHIARRDHWWKPLGYGLLTVHWFNPIMWVAYILLCRDIELACDEKVIKQMENRQRADYSQSLLTCSIHRKMILACPVAFGEVGVKERVKNVLNYRKPGLWITLLTVLAMVVSLVCFATVQPVQAEENPPEIIENQSPTTDNSGPEIQEADDAEYNRGGSTTMVTSTGIEYTLSATQVSPIGMRLAFAVDVATTFHIHEYFWLEKQTEDGWVALERHMEAPALIAMNVYTRGNSPWGAYDWPVDWSGIYGVLEPGTYRLWTTVYEGEDLCSVEFVIGDPGESVKAQALRRCYDAVQAILEQDHYHLEHIYKDIYDAVAETGANTYNIIDRHVYTRAGENYLKQDMFSLYGEAVDGVMIRDGVEYRLVNSEMTTLLPPDGWIRWPGTRLEVYTRWVHAFTWNMNEVKSAEMTEDTVTLHLDVDYLVHNGNVLSDTVTFGFDENGKLEWVEQVTAYGPNSRCKEAHTVTETLQVLDSSAEEIEGVLDAQDVNFYWDFSWTEDQESIESVADREIVNTDVSPVTTVAEVIDRAAAETDAAYSNIKVYRDEAAGVWKVEFLVSNGKASTDVVYLDDNGVTLMIVLLGPSDI